MNINFRYHQQANWIIIDIFNYIQILQTHNYNSDLIAIMTPQTGVGVTPASGPFACLYSHLNKQMQSIVYVQKGHDRNVPRLKWLIPEWLRPKRPNRKVLFRWFDIIVVDCRKKLIGTRKATTYSLLPRLTHINNNELCLNMLQYEYSTTLAR